MAGIPLRIGMPADCNQSPYQKSLLPCPQSSLGMMQSRSWWHSTRITGGSYFHGKSGGNPHESGARFVESKFTSPRFFEASVGALEIDFFEYPRIKSCMRRSAAGRRPIAVRRHRVDHLLARHCLAGLAKDQRCGIERAWLLCVRLVSGLRRHFLRGPRRINLRGLLHRLGSDLCLWGFLRCHDPSPHKKCGLGNWPQRLSLDQSGQLPLACRNIKWMGIGILKVFHDGMLAYGQLQPRPAVANPIHTRVPVAGDQSASRQLGRFRQHCHHRVRGHGPRDQGEERPGTLPQERTRDVCPGLSRITQNRPRPPGPGMSGPLRLGRSLRPTCPDVAT
jgi:hypothetical protein